MAVALKDTYRRRLLEVALDRYGYVTTDDATAVGIPAVELRKLAQRGGITRVGHSLYRFDDVPVTALDNFVEAVLWAGRDAVLAGESVLALHGLAQVNPAILRVNTPHRVRKTPRGDIELTRADIPVEDITCYFGIPSTTVARAIRDTRTSVMTSRLREAVRRARDEGLLSVAEQSQLEDELAST